MVFSPCEVIPLIFFLDRKLYYSDRAVRVQYKIARVTLLQVLFDKDVLLPVRQ